MDDSQTAHPRPRKQVVQGAPKDYEEQSKLIYSYSNRNLLNTFRSSYAGESVQ